jgi:hypothetical protein
MKLGDTTTGRGEEPTPEDIRRDLLALALRHLRASREAETAAQALDEVANFYAIAEAPL